MPWPQLMLDGAVVNDHRIRVTCEESEVDYEQFVDGENDNVQAAIFELEARADWWANPSMKEIVGPWMGDLAYEAVAEVYRRDLIAPCRYRYEVHLEAAALLRDGWRPESWDDLPF